MEDVARVVGAVAGTDGSEVVAPITSARSRGSTVYARLARTSWGFSALRWVLRGEGAL